jgi:hypothetical protein
MDNRAQALREALAATVQPLKDEYDRLLRDIERAEAELTELRQLRTEYRTIIRAADPDAIPATSKPKSKPSGAAEYRPGTPRSEQVLAYVRENFNSDEFSVPDLMARPDYAERVGVTQSPLSKILRGLADAGTLRLDRVGGIGGRQKFYRLTRAADER